MRSHLFINSLLLCCLLSLTTFAQGRNPTRKPAPSEPPAQPATVATPELAQDSQTQPALEKLSPEEVQLLVQIMLAEQQARLAGLTQKKDKDQPDPMENLARLYALAITKHPKLLPRLIGQALTPFYEGKESARGAAQVSQVADEAGIKFQLIIMAQNQRIIELLELIARKR
jgi:hypothetical protein